MHPSQSDGPHAGNVLSAADYLKQWEDALRRFREASRGPQPGPLTAIRTYLAPFAPEQRPEVLADLVAEHLQASWERGQGSRLEAYLAEFGTEFPELASPAVVPTDLVQAEFLARYASPRGDFPAPEEYLQRFSGREDVVALLQAQLLDGERYVRVRRQGTIGGMGQVWLAYDRHLRRHVALKEPKPEFRVRLAEEARLTAGLEHPAIVSVHEYQETGSGTPFYVMRLVHGQTLRKLIHDYYSPPRARPDGERRILWNRMLQAFLTVCDAIAYAHRHDVLHRDLKPGNVIVGEFGETVLLDWGLAKKAHGAASQTQVSGAPDLGTPSSTGDTPAQFVLATMPPSSPAGTIIYMAPEQLEGITTVRSDVFGLGAILYEILTGRAPYEEPDRDQSTVALISRVQEADIKPPRRLRRQVSRALEAVCLKALARDPADRYTSAAELGNDVRRYQADEPVAAYREPFWAKLGRWSRRYKSVVAAAVALLVTAVLSLTVLAVVLERSRANIQAEQERTDAQRLRAETSYRLAREGLEEAFKLVRDDPRLRSGSMEDLRRMLSQAQARFYQKFIELRGDEPEFQAERGRALMQLGYVTQVFGLKEKALEDFEQALAIFADLAAEHPTVPQYRQELAGCQSGLGILLRQLGKQTEAEAACRAALKEFERLTAEHAAVPDYFRGLATSHNNLAFQLAGLGKQAEAKAAYHAALVEWQRLTAQYPEVPQYRKELATTQNNLGNLLARLDKRAEAEVAYHAAVHEWERLAAKYPEAPEYRQELARGRNNLGILLAGLGKQAQAEVEYRAAQKEKERLAAEHPTVPEYRQELAQGHNNLGILLAALGKWAEAEAAYRTALKERQRLTAEYPNVPEYRLELAGGHNNLGLLLAGLGKRAEAEEAYRAALKELERLRADHPDVPQYRQDLARAHCNQANLLTGLGKRAEAEEAYRAAVKELERLRAGHPDVPQYCQDLARTHNNFGALLVRVGKRAEAEAAFRTAQKEGERLAAGYPQVPEYRQDLGRSHNNLGGLLARLGKPAEAEEAYRAALAQQERLATKHPAVPEYRQDLGRSHNNLGALCSDMGRSKEAVQAFGEAFGIYEALTRQYPEVPEYKSDLRDTCRRRAGALRRLARYAEALSDWDRILKMDGEKKPDIALNRALTLARLGRHTEATVEADAVTNGKQVNGGLLYAAACVYSLSAKSAAGDGILAERYAACAVEILRQAIQKGYKDLDHLRKDEGLAPLHSRRDYQDLLKEVESSAASPAKSP